jgi:cysteinyl-tRNA synthetase
MLQIYNTFTKKKEKFSPINPGKVSMYSCGPTVYGYIHIGNLRAYFTADLLRRYLEYSGFEVRHIKNITDVGHLTDDDIAQGDSGDDKMMMAAKREKKTPEEIARFYENYAKEKELEMNILPAHFFPRATEHIPQMINIISTLIKKGCAYENNGNVFFSVEKFENYGKLSGNTIENLDIGARLDDPHPDKKNQWDFALWLKAPDDHIMKWDSPWSLGYPGWHIECSAMSMEYLGETFDIHTGGEDNIFPHHEAEIAQSECANNAKFVHYWVHNRHLLADGVKMSKSKGNLYTIEDIKEKGFTPMDLRMNFLLSHYRSQMNFTWATMQQAHKNIETLRSFSHRIREYSPHVTSDQKIDVSSYGERFDKEMNDDLNTPGALTVLFEFINKTNTLIDVTSLANPDQVKIFFEKILNVFGLVITDNTPEKISQNVLDLAKKREDARKKGNFAHADQFRDEINASGYEVIDTAGGYSLQKK